MYKGDRIPLDPSLRCTDSLEFESELRKRVVGQEEAVTKTTEVIQKFMANLNDQTRPVGNILLLGPTGTGKTRLVEAVCEVMFDDIKGMVRIDCAEFKQSHDIAKIIGAPPGYIGHTSSSTQITQERLDKTYNEDIQLSVLLLDEIEKAHDHFWDLLLGIMDKGRLTDNQGRIIDLTHTLIFITSNLGAREVQAAMDGSIGFVSNAGASDEVARKISTAAAAKKFTPEFMNRIDQVITFQYLGHSSMENILAIEINQIQKRILDSKHSAKFVFTCSDPVKEFLLQEGTNKRYGARHLKRTLEKYLVNALVNFVMTAQVTLGDLVEITILDKELQFSKIPAEVIIPPKPPEPQHDDDEWPDTETSADEYSFENREGNP